MNLRTLEGVKLPSPARRAPSGLRSTGRRSFGPTHRSTSGWCSPGRFTSTTRIRRPFCSAASITTSRQAICDGGRCQGSCPAGRGSGPSPIGGFFSCSGRTPFGSIPGPGKNNRPSVSAFPTPDCRTPGTDWGSPATNSTSVLEIGADPSCATARERPAHHFNALRWTTVGQKHAVAATWSRSVFGTAEFRIVDLRYEPRKVRNGRPQIRTVGSGAGHPVFRIGRMDYRTHRSLMSAGPAPGMVLQTCFS